MSRRLAGLTLDTVSDLPVPCRSCIAWELDPVAARSARRAGGVELEKESWLSAVLLEWGSCGRIAYVDDEPVGFVTYAPPQFVPRASAFPTSPVSQDAVVLMTGGVQPVHRGGGIARMLVQGAAKDLTRRGVRALAAGRRAFHKNARRATANAPASPIGASRPTAGAPAWARR